MTALLCLGGPLHGRFVDPGDRMALSAEMPDRAMTASYESIMTEREQLIRQGADPGDLIEPLRPLPHKVTYHRMRVMVLGWRFPLNCLTNWPAGSKVPDGCVLPGMVYGVPAESEPTPGLPDPLCRCARYGLVTALLYGPNRSSCYLDHCRVHGPFREKGKTS